jgi:hypothetical protein
MIQAESALSNNSNRIILPWQQKRRGTIRIGGHDGATNLAGADPNIHIVS